MECEPDLRHYSQFYYAEYDYAHNIIKILVVFFFIKKGAILSIIIVYHETDEQRALRGSNKVKILVCCSLQILQIEMN